MQHLLDTAPQADHYFRDAFHRAIWFTTQVAIKRCGIRARPTRLRRIMPNFDTVSLDCEQVLLLFAVHSCLACRRSPLFLLLEPAQLHKQRFPAYPTHLIDFVPPVCQTIPYFGQAVRVTALGDIIRSRVKRPLILRSPMRETRLTEGCSRIQKWPNWYA